MELSWMRGLLLATVAIYFVFDHWDSKQIKDEREELIRLKTFELVHKITTVTLCLVAVAYSVWPSMNAMFPLMLLILAFLYTEIGGKIYFRRKL